MKLLIYATFSEVGPNFCKNYGQYFLRRHGFTYCRVNWPIQYSFIILLPVLKIYILCYFAFADNIKGSTNGASKSCDTVNKNIYFMYFSRRRLCMFFVYLKNLYFTTHWSKYKKLCLSYGNSITFLTFLSVEGHFFVSIVYI